MFINFLLKIVLCLLVTSGSCFAVNRQLHEGKGDQKSDFSFIQINNNEIREIGVWRNIYDPVYFESNNCKLGQLPLQGNYIPRYLNESANPAVFIEESKLSLFLYTPWNGLTSIETVDELKQLAAEYESGEYVSNKEDFLWFNLWERRIGEWKTPLGRSTFRGCTNPEELFEGDGYQGWSEAEHYYEFRDGITWNGKKKIDNIEDWNALIEDIYDRSYRVEAKDWRIR